MKLTRRSTLTGLGATALAMPFVRPSWAATGSLHVYNWSDYIGETTIADFEAASGLSVVYDLYASAEEMQAKMLAGSTGYDVVLQSGVSLPRFIKAGVYQKLDRARLPSWSNLNPDILRIIEGYDPTLEYNVPYMWGSVGVTYNVTMVRERLGDIDLNNLDVIMNPENAAKLADCGISLLDSPDDIGFMVMSWLGIDPNVAKAEDFDRMIAAFKEIREYVATFDNANYLTTLPNQEICVANNWSGDYGVAKARAAEAGIELDLQYFVPKTGAPAWFDLWSVPADTANLDGAYLFLEYMMQPEVIAACTNFTGYANVNSAATAFVDPAVANDPAIYPNAETLSRMYTLKPRTDEQERLMTRAWAEVKGG